MFVSRAESPLNGDPDRGVDICLVAGRYCAHAPFVLVNAVIRSAAIVVQAISDLQDFEGNSACSLRTMNDAWQSCMEFCNLMRNSVLNWRNEGRHGLQG